MDTPLTRFAPAILAASESAIKSDITLDGQLVLNRAGPLTVSYAPFEHIQRGAKVVIVGITPGAQQACNALCEVRRRLRAGDDSPAALAAAKVFASFSGPMRANLVDTLDHIGLSHWLGVPSTADLWTFRSDLVHFTSALRYPVFLNGHNYNGSPAMDRTPILTRLLDDCLKEEAEAIPDAVWVPLGGKAEAGVQYLVHKGHLKEGRVLSGLPHPSGANGERIAYFVGRKARESLSTKTNPDQIEAARKRLINQVKSL